MRKLITLLFIIPVCLLLAIWSPWLNWNISIAGLFGAKSPDKISSLTVYSQGGDIEILIDGQSQGTVNKATSPFIVDKVTPGERLVAIKRTSTESSDYYTFSKLVNFIAGTDVRLSYRLGPSEEFSTGHIIYSVDKEDLSRDSKLNIILNVEDASVLIDNLPAVSVTDGKLVENLNLDSQHQVSISKEGYDTVEFTILPETQEDRDKLKNYDITIESHLMLTPLDVE